MLNTVSSRQIQREYKKILAQANKINQPIIIMSNNQPQGAVIGLDLLEKSQLNLILQEAVDEYKKGKTISIANKKELDEYLKDIEHD